MPGKKSKSKRANAQAETIKRLRAELRRAKTEARKAKQNAAKQSKTAKQVDRVIERSYTKRAKTVDKALSKKLKPLAKRKYKKLKPLSKLTPTDKANLRSALDRAVTLGIYKPASRKLTKARVAKVRSLIDLMKKDFRADTITIAPFKGKASSRKRQANQAKAAGYRVTATGVVIPRDKTSKSETATLQYDKTLGEWQVKVARKSRKGQRSTDIRPFASPERIAADKTAIRAMTTKYELGNEARFRAYLFGNPASATRQTFGSMDSLMKYMERYERQNDQSFNSKIYDGLLITIVQRPPGERFWRNADDIETVRRGKYKRKRRAKGATK